MYQSKIYIWIVSFIKWLIVCYDDCFIGRAVADICSFFSRKANESILVGLFREKFVSGALVCRSKALHLITAPLRLLKNIYINNSAYIDTAKSQSHIYNLICSLPYIPLRQYGIVLTAFGLGLTAGMLTLGEYSLISALVSAFIIICSLVLCMINVSANSVVSSSSFFSFVCEVLFCDKPVYDDKVHKLAHPVATALFFAVAGFGGGILSPVITVLSILAAIAIFAILYSPVIGVYLIVPLAPILPTMASAGLICLTVMSYLIHLATDPKTDYKSTPFFVWIVSFIFLACFASFTSVTPMSSIRILMIYIVFTLSFVLIANTIKTKQQWGLLLALLVMSTFLVSLYGVYQNFFIDSTTQSWVDSEMFEDIKTRVYSTLDNPNVLGQFLILTIPVCIACMLSAKKLFHKVIYMAVTALAAACLAFTWSRGAWVGVVLAVAVFFLMKDKRWIAIGVLALAVMPFILPESIMTRLLSIGNTGDSSTSYRVSVWIGSIRLIRDFWATGIGLGSDAFLEIYPGYALGGATFALHSHNFYLQWIVDMGIAGLIVYFMILLTALKSISTVKRDTPLIRNALFAMAGALVGYLFQGMAENLWYNYRMILIFWIYMAFIHTGAHISNTKELNPHD